MRKNHSDPRLRFRCRPWQGLLLVCGAVLTVGCGGEAAPPTGTVSGTIAFKKPTAAQLDLMIIDPQTGKAASTQVGPEGEFSFGSPMLVGEYIAYFAPQMDPNVQQAVAVKIDRTIPEMYWNEIQSPLRVSISEGSNTASLQVE